jgi:hypothetical protein
VAQRSDCKGILESKGVADGRSARGEGAGEHSSWMGGRKGRWKAGWKVDRSNYDLYNGISRGRAEEPRASYPSPLDPFSTICGSRDYRCPSRPTRPAEVEKSFTTRAGPPPPPAPPSLSRSPPPFPRVFFFPLRCRGRRCSTRSTRVTPGNPDKFFGPRRMGFFGFR